MSTLHHTSQATSPIRHGRRVAILIAVVLAAAALTAGMIALGSADTSSSAGIVAPTAGTPPTYGDLHYETTHRRAPATAVQRSLSPTAIAAYNRAHNRHEQP